MVVTGITSGACAQSVGGKSLHVCGNEIVNHVIGKLTAPDIIRHVKHYVFRKRFSDFIARKERKFKKNVSALDVVEHCCQ